MNAPEHAPPTKAELNDLRERLTREYITNPESLAVPKTLLARLLAEAEAADAGRRERSAALEVVASMRPEVQRIEGLLKSYEAEVAVLRLERDAALANAVALEALAGEMAQYPFDSTSGPGARRWCRHCGQSVKSSAPRPTFEHALDCPVARLATLQADRL